jgi:Ca-activated chloride channel family protein
VTESGKVRCVVSADNVSFGGGPIVVCQPAAGGPFPQAPWAASKFDERLNLAVKRGPAGQFNWQKGDLAASGQEMVLSPGQTVNLNGWTVESEETRTKFTYDATGKGMYIGIVTLRQF